MELEQPPRTSSASALFIGQLAGKANHPKAQAHPDAPANGKAARDAYSPMTWQAIRRRWGIALCSHR